MFRVVRSLDPFRQLALLAVATNALYIIWLFFHVNGALGYAFWVLEFAVSLVTFTFAFNHFTRRYVLLGGNYSLRASVDVFILTVNESPVIVEETIRAATEILSPRVTIFLLDDGNRQSMRKLAEQYAIEYLSRPDAKKNRYKSANLNYGLQHSYGDFILTLDADSVVLPGILDDMLGHFKDSSVGIVASRQSFNVGKYDFNHDHLFYNYMQSGKNADGAAISCGTGVIYRRKSLETIGGFSEWNVVEDLHTTYVMNAHGIKTVYVTQPYVTGHAPNDVSTIYKQRGTWAIDTLRMFFWQQPLIQRKLSVRQRMHYFEIGYCYLVSAFALTGIYLVNYLSLFSNDYIVNDGIGYLITRIPALICTLLLFGYLSQGQLTSRIWAGLFPIYIKATFIAAFSPKKKPRYKVTSKADHNQREVRLVLTQIGFIVLGVVALCFNVFEYGLSYLLLTNVFWLAVMAYCLLPIIEKGLKIGRYA